MAKNISLMGADYPDVPAVQLPKTGGGTATFYDINVIDNLNSDSSTDALSAKQGKELNNKISSIYIDSATGTTSSSGNISKTMVNKVRILSAWTSTDACVVLPYPAAGADGDGQYTWWFHILTDNASSSPVANKNVTVYFTYIRT